MSAAQLLDLLHPTTPGLDDLLSTLMQVEMAEVDDVTIKDHAIDQLSSFTVYLAEQGNVTYGSFSALQESVRFVLTSQGAIGQVLMGAITDHYYGMVGE